MNVSVALFSHFHTLIFTEEFVLLKLSPEGHEFAILNDAGNQSDAVMIMIRLDICDIQVLVTLKLRSAYAFLCFTCSFNHQLYI